MPPRCLSLKRVRAFAARTGRENRREKKALCAVYGLPDAKKMFSKRLKAARSPRLLLDINREKPRMKKIALLFALLIHSNQASLITLSSASQAREDRYT